MFTCLENSVTPSIYFAGPPVYIIYVRSRYCLLVLNPGFQDILLLNLFILFTCEATDASMPGEFGDTLNIFCRSTFLYYLHATQEMLNCLENFVTPSIYSASRHIHFYMQGRRCFLVFRTPRHLHYILQEHF